MADLCPVSADDEAVPADEHEAVPQPDTAYSLEGMNAGRRADLSFPYHFPAEAHCVTCGTMIRRDRYMATDDPDKDAWHHTGRKPGES